jgi:putative transcriptional regulator
MEHLDDILPEWALGTLAPAELEAAERHLAGCARCRTEAARLVPARQALTALVTPVEPPPAVLNQLMEQMEGPGRFARFADRVAAFFGLTRDKALEVLQSLSDPSAWMPGPVAGTELLPVETGGERQGMMAAFLRLHPGVRYPRHSHHGGREWNLVLEGGFREDDGHEVWPGEELEKSESSAHGFTALDGPACICASVLEGATSFEEEFASPEA